MAPAAKNSDFNGMVQKLEEDFENLQSHVDEISKSLKERMDELGIQLEEQGFKVALKVDSMEEAIQRLINQGEGDITHTASMQGALTSRATSVKELSKLKGPAEDVGSSMGRRDEEKIDDDGKGFESFKRLSNEELQERREKNSPNHVSAYKQLKVMLIVGGAVDILVVEQQDGSFKSSPWYVRFTFGKFQQVLKAKEKVVSIKVNGVEAGFHLYLDNKGEAYFLGEEEVEEGDTLLSVSSSGEDTLVIQSALNCSRSSDSENIGNRKDAIEDEKDMPKVKATKNKTRVTSPTSEQVSSLNLKEGRNTVVFTFSNPILGKKQVDARIYLWKWDTRIVISDVDGTITRSDLLGQVMPWVGVDWSQTGVANLFSAIKENGYQWLYLSPHPISQAYHIRQFLFNLKQDGKALPDGPVVISPDGFLRCLYREVVRRAPHEFKISCLKAINALFPPDTNPFYAGFGNRDTDEFSYLKVGIPKGKIFIINPKGEVVVNGRVYKSYTSCHPLVNDTFPSRTSSEQVLNKEKKILYPYRRKVGRSMRLDDFYDHVFHAYETISLDDVETDTSDAEYTDDSNAADPPSRHTPVTEDDARAYVFADRDIASSMTYRTAPRPPVLSRSDHAYGEKVGRSMRLDDFYDHVFHAYETISLDDVETDTSNAEYTDDSNAADPPSQHTRHGG